MKAYYDCCARNDAEQAVLDVSLSLSNPIVRERTIRDLVSHPRTAAYSDSVHSILKNEMDSEVALACLVYFETLKRWRPECVPDQIYVHPVHLEYQVDATGARTAPVSPAVRDIAERLNARASVQGSVQARRAYLDG